MPEFRFASIFSKITTENLDNAICDIQLENNNIKSFSIIDTYDIIDYCFPQIFNPNIEYSKEDLISHHLVYQFLFVDSPHKPIVLDEYRVELFANWHRLDSIISEYSQYEDFKQEIISRYNKLKHPKDKVDFIESNIGLILALAFETLSISPIERYNSLITKYLQINKFACEDKEDQKIINDIFFNTECTLDRARDIFDRFCENVKYYLTELDEEKKFIYLDNTYRDIKVFDRIINVNKKLISKEYLSKLNKKYIFNYFSSTPYKSKHIGELFKYHLPNLEGIVSYTMRRSKYDVYLYKLLDIGEPKMTLDFINILKDSAQRSKINSFRNADLSSVSKKLIRNIDKLVVEAKKEVEKEFIKYKSLNTYMTKFRMAIDTLKKTKKDMGMSNLFIEFLTQMETKKTSRLLDDLNLTMSNFKDNYSIRKDFADYLTSVHRRGKLLFISIAGGKDEVRSLVQSFPILLFMNTIYHQEDVKNIQELFLQIITPDYKKSKSKSLIQKYINLSSTNIFRLNSLERKIYFLLLRYFIPTEERYSEEKIIEELDHIIDINSKRDYVQEKIIKSGKSFLDIILEPKAQLHIDLMYFKTWMLRRINKHDDAIDILNKLIDGKYKDGRLYQSRALCYKNKYYYEVNTGNINDLENYLYFALSDFESCSIQYKIYSKKVNNKVIEPMQIAILNSIADTFTKLYLLYTDKYEEDIKVARKDINEVKKRLEKLGLIYEKFPAYNHTEADIEYCEARIALVHNDYDLFKKKIKEAYKRYFIIDESKLLSGLESLDTTRINIFNLAKSQGLRLL